MTDKIIESGIPAIFLKGDTDQLPDSSLDATYIGIDFGTSTTVASYAVFDKSERRMVSEPIPVNQVAADGPDVTYHLIPTAIGWKNTKLLIGTGAAKLKTRLIEGVDLFTSFKMHLGVDLGPQYPNTVLTGKNTPTTITNPQEATETFFKYLHKELTEFTRKNKLPEKIHYAISVPASFEANQRADLIRAVRAADMTVTDSALIDEPNAAFLSYLLNRHQNSSGTSLLDTIRKQATRVLVFDFGAGTCDISILEVKTTESQVSSRNLAISKFLALGGNNIDRAIATDVLLPMLCGQDNPQNCFTTAELHKFVLPRLKHTAEKLKITMCSRLERHNITSISKASKCNETVFDGEPVLIELKNKEWKIDKPSLTAEQFTKVMQKFLADQATQLSNGTDITQGYHNILEPIDNAVAKAGLEKDDLNMVLFIGGSCENPLVRGAIEKHLGRFCDCVTPADLRSHVSQGAAFHSLCFNGMGWELIQPIVSEPICVITRDGKAKAILPPGSTVPSVEISTGNLEVSEDKQSVIELPICVGSPDKLLTVITIRCTEGDGYFQRGDKVTVRCQITRDKLLKVQVDAPGSRTEHKLMNPLANQELTETDKGVLKAKVALDQSILDNRGKPSINTVSTYGHALQNAGRWREAAECFENIERLSPSSNYSTTICYFYSRAGDRKQSDKWANIAHERNPSGTTAFNLALAYERERNMEEYERLMEQGLRLDPNNACIKASYGPYLAKKGDPRGMDLTEEAFDEYSSQHHNGNLQSNDHSRLQSCARTLGKADPIKTNENKDNPGSKTGYSSNNLLSDAEGTTLLEQQSQ